LVCFITFLNSCSCFMGIIVSIMLFTMLASLIKKKVIKNIENIAKKIEPVAQISDENNLEKDEKFTNEISCC